MAVLDVSGLSYFLPIISFLLVWVIIFSLLTKTKILGENTWINSLTGIFIAVIFVTFGSVRQYVETVTPWFVVLIVALFFILAIIGFSQNKIESIMKPGFTWVFIAILIVIFVISAMVVFNDILSPYLPGGSTSNDADPTLLKISKFLFSSKFLGAFTLLIVAAIVSWVVVKK